MNTPCRFAPLRIALAVTGALFFATAADASCNFAGADTALDNLIAADGVSGGALIVGSAKGILHEYFTGTYTRNVNNVPTTFNYDRNAILPLASATKLLSGVRVLQVAGAGWADLDAPVSQYLPAPTFPWQPSAASITLREMFSHTAGYGNDEDDLFINDPNETLFQSVANIASHPAVAPQNYLPAPTEFAYGGVAMQIGGEVVQMTSQGQTSPLGGVESGDWQADWQHDLGAPLCAATIDWGGLGATQNYRISGGGEASLEDYARVLAMLLSNGVGNGTRLLTPGAVATWKASQTGSAVSGCSDGCVPSAETFTLPGGGTYANTQYSVGAWIEPQAADGGASLSGAPVVSSIGKFGFAPWVDYASGTYGILMIYDTANAGETGSNTASVTSHAAMQRIITDAVAGVRAQVPASGMCPSMTVYDHLFADKFDGAPVVSCPGTVQLP